MKPKKKRKLRNAEYYDIQSVLDELYEKSKSDCKFVDLISIIASEENIKLELCFWKICSRTFYTKRDNFLGKMRKIFSKYTPNEKI